MDRALPIFLVLVTVGATLQGQFIIAAIFGIWFSFVASAAWLLPFAFLIDGYFGAFYEVPWLSIITTMVFFVTELARPYLAWHTKETL